MKLHLKDTVHRILSIYAQMDQDVGQFQRKSELRCIEKCGQCCWTADVQTTVLEMLPTALSLYQGGEVDVWLRRLSDHEPKRVCIFFNEIVGPGQLGHCTNYTLRPSICRLFGFSAVRNRRGSLELAACKFLKLANPESVVQALTHQAEAPCYTDCTTQLYAIDLSSKFELLPINEALKNAFLKIGLRMQMAEAQTMET